MPHQLDVGRRRPKARVLAVSVLVAWWAVGWYSAGAAGRVLILHWNGSRWRTVLK